CSALKDSADLEGWLPAIQLTNANGDKMQMRPYMNWDWTFGELTIPADVKPGEYTGVFPLVWVH
ncbi:MAG: hypothetical protein IJF12_04340, partial [Alphaproteobacteria bacterium]|nr:hypothetical protein [Alphaproteobacteria bacterium]